MALCLLKHSPALIKNGWGLNYFFKPFQEWLKSAIIGISTAE
jgi:hypothetical protein